MKKNNSFQMKNDYWEIAIDKANHSEVKMTIIYKSSKIPLGEIQKLEECIRQILMACGRLDKLQPSRR